MNLIKRFLFPLILLIIIQLFAPSYSHIAQAQITKATKNPIQEEQEKQILEEGVSPNAFKVFNKLTSHKHKSRNIFQQSTKSTKKQRPTKSSIQGIKELKLDLKNTNSTQKLNNMLEKSKQSKKEIGVRKTYEGFDDFFNDQKAKMKKLQKDIDTLEKTDNHIVNHQNQKSKTIIFKPLKNKEKINSPSLKPNAVQTKMNKIFQIVEDIQQKEDKLEKLENEEQKKQVNNLTKEQSAAELKKKQILIKKRKKVYILNKISYFNSSTKNLLALSIFILFLASYYLIDCFSDIDQKKKKFEEDISTLNSTQKSQDPFNNKNGASLDDDDEEQQSLKNNIDQNEQI